MSKTLEITAVSSAKLTADCIFLSLSPSLSLSIAGGFVGVKERLCICEYLSLLAAAAAAAAACLCVQDICSAPVGSSAETADRKVDLRPDLNTTNHKTQVLRRLFFIFQSGSIKPVMLFYLHVQ